MGKRKDPQVVIMQLATEIKRLQFELSVARDTTTKFCADAACIAAHSVFKRKGDIMSDFMVQYLEIVQEIAQLAIEDSKTEGGEYLEYHKTKVDEAVKAAMGEKYFLPFDERHGLKEVKKDG